MCENSVAAQQIAPANRLSNEHKKHIPSDDPWLTYGAFGPKQKVALRQVLGEVQTFSRAYRLGKPGHYPIF